MEQLAQRLYSWASILAPNAREQAVLTSNLPFVFPHLALMPDAHLGKGATVGSVIPTDKAIIPAAVGVDIGCGMIAVRTQFSVSQIMEVAGRKNSGEISGLSALREMIEDAIPLSAGNYNTDLTTTAIPRITDLTARWAKIHPEDEYGPTSYAGNWALQLGSLGSGNHFIEVSSDELDRVWLFLHSGSRGVGNKIAQHHIKVAQRLAKQWFIELPDPDLAYLPQGTPQFSLYLKELTWAQHFALENREEMMNRVEACLSAWMESPVEVQERINCHHNYTSQERHFGRDVWVSRKGAINAAEGVDGLIPGSMGAASYIVTGRGNPMSLNSAPHGAGRQHSRNQARKLFTQDGLREAMGIIEYRDTDAFIDEHPDAYKDIDVVMHDAKDLVEIQHTLRQIVNVKGD